ncbi:hypothetical protein FEE96_22875 [Parasedimentitalea maritima]|uniref:Uncharacterized protein n=1 Tax=Parasedimentitalea maritima TaxID=2578117 RepID=A0ABY2UNW4_9RHOB|nr:hypothetical protein [Zongyanglinia marina]TLP55320.1 hypothetical protein FEE96_22875 [Zongyanglinia marina]
MNQVVRNGETSQPEVMARGSTSQSQEEAAAKLKIEIDQATQSANGEGGSSKAKVISFSGTDVQSEDGSPQSPPNFNSFLREAHAAFSPQGRFKSVLLSGHRYTDWEDLVNSLDADGIHFSKSGITENIGTSTTAAILTFLSDPTPNVSANQLKDLTDSGVIKFENGSLHIDVSKAGHAQLERLVVETQKLDDGTSNAEHLNKIDPFLRGHISMQAKKALGLDQVTEGDGGVVLKMTLPEGTNIYDPGQITKALNDGLIVVDKDGFSIGSTLRLPVNQEKRARKTGTLNARMDVLNDLYSAAGNIHDNSGVTGSSTTSDNTLVNSSKQFFTDYSTFGAKLNEYVRLAEHSEVPVGTGEKLRLKEIMKLADGEIRTGLRQLVELGQQNALNVANDVPEIPPEPSLFGAIFGVFASAGFVTSGGATLLKGIDFASSTGMAGSLSSLASSSSGLSNWFGGGGTIKGLEDKLRADFGEETFETAGQAVHGFRRAARFFAENDMAKEFVKIKSWGKGTKEIGMRTFQEGIASQVLWDFTQNGFYKGNLKRPSAGITRDQFMEHDDNFRLLESMGWNVEFRGTSHNWFKEDKKRYAQINEKIRNGEELSKYENAYWRNEYVQMYMWRDKGVGLANEKYFDGSRGRQLRTGDPDSHHTNYKSFNKDVKSGYAQELLDNDELVNDAMRFDTADLFNPALTPKPADPPS